jgi:hypothetical protein
MTSLNLTRAKREIALRENVILTTPDRAERDLLVLLETAQRGSLSSFSAEADSAGKAVSIPSYVDLEPSCFSTFVSGNPGDGLTTQMRIDESASEQSATSLIACFKLLDAPNWHILSAGEDFTRIAGSDGLLGFCISVVDHLVRNADSLSNLNVRTFGDVVDVCWPALSTHWTGIVSALEDGESLGLGTSLLLQRFGLLSWHRGHIQSIKSGLSLVRSVDVNGRNRALNDTDIARIAQSIGACGVSSLTLLVEAQKPSSTRRRAYQTLVAAFWQHLLHARLASMSTMAIRWRVYIEKGVLSGVGVPLLEQATVMHLDRGERALLSILVKRLNPNCKFDESEILKVLDLIYWFGGINFQRLLTRTKKHSLRSALKLFSEAVDDAIANLKPIVHQIAISQPDPNQIESTSSKDRRRRAPSVIKTLT